jgi:hypothetical protein
MPPRGAPREINPVARPRPRPPPRWEGNHWLEMLYAMVVGMAVHVGR